MSEVVLYQEQPLAERQQYASQIAFAASMLPSGIRGANADETAARAFLVMETGAMLGLHPIAALSSVNVIEGKPAMSADLMVSVIRGAGHKVHVTEAGTVEGGDYKATVTIIRSDDPEHPFSSTWTPQRAARAGLCKYEQNENGQWTVTARSEKGKALPWELYTENLCKARAKSEAARDGASDNLHGVRYTPEELGAEVDAAGNPIVTTLGAAPEPVEEEKPSALPKATKRATNGRQGTRRKKAADPVEEAAPAADENVVDAEVVEEPPTPETPAQEPSDPEAEERAARAAMAAEQERQVTERERIIATADEVDRDDEAAVKAWNAENGPATGHYITSSAEVERTREAMAGAPDEPTPPEHIEPEFVDTKTGVVYATQAEMDAAIRARVQAKVNEDTAAAPAPASEPPADAAAPSPFELARAEEPENFARQIEAADHDDQLKNLWMELQASGNLTTELRVAIVNRKAALEGSADA